MLLLEDNKLLNNPDVLELDVRGYLLDRANASKQSSKSFFNRLFSALKFSVSDDPYESVNPLRIGSLRNLCAASALNLLAPRFSREDEEEGGNGTRK